MKILYILKRELDGTGKVLLETHKQQHEVSVVGINDKSGNELLDLIESHDKLIMW